MKKLLFIAHRIPYPPNKGDKIRSFHELKSLAQDYEIDLVAFVDDKKDYQYTYKLNDYCSNIYLYSLTRIAGLIKSFLFFLIGKSLSEGYYFNFKTYNQIKSLVKNKNYDVIFCYSAQVAQYVLKYDNTKRIMDFVDVDSDKWLQYSKERSFPLSIIYKFEYQRLLEYEKRIAKNFKLSIFCTNLDVELFKNQFHDGNIVSINNGVDSAYFNPMNGQKEKAIVFVGAMDYFPNIDAVTWFVEKVFLKMLEKIKDLKFYIVGSNPDPDVKKLANYSDNIIVTGFVDDIRPYMAKAKIAVMPIRIARGIQNKILEAMSMELPVIINEKLMESLSNLKKDMVYIYKDKNDLHNLIETNINNDTALREMGVNLRTFVKQNYDWETNLNKMKQYILEC